MVNVKFTTAALFLAASLLRAQAPAAGPAPHKIPPVYTVTIVSRTAQAINYGQRNMPTKVDFKGTVLMPSARGEASVEARRGSTTVQAKFDRVPSPTRFGPQYLTYVLWAITPEGRPVNLGELVLDPSNHGKLSVSTNLQVFAMIVTAEPYFSVTQPSDVVVLENHMRPDTLGTTEALNVKYELLPRKRFTYDESKTAQPSGPKVSYSQYEATLALYQALNAIQIARSAGADRLAADSYTKATTLYERARQYLGQRAASQEIINTAREAAQAAEDARLIALKRQPPSADRADTQ